MRAGQVIAICLAAVFVVAVIFFTATPMGRSLWNDYTHGLNKADENNYETRKQVEDTARSYLADYNADVDIYRAYCNSSNPDKQEYAEAARIRAIRTANSYNEYLRKNSYVWKDNMPSDLPYTLPTDITSE